MIYLSALVLHVVAAVLGVGQVMAIAFAARAAAPDVALLTTLAKTTRASLGVMLLSGIAMMAVTNGVYGHSWWLRGSVLIFLVVGVLNGQVFRALRAQAFHRVRVLALTMSGLVSIAVALMEAKP